LFPLTFAVSPDHLCSEIAFLHIFNSSNVNEKSLTQIAWQVMELLSDARNVVNVNCLSTGDKTDAA